MSATVLHVALFEELDAFTLYALLRLRSDVFVVEQQCPYPDLDGRDLEPGTRHVWYTEPHSDEPLAYLRLLSDVDGAVRIGRVVTAKGARGSGLSRQLLSAALDLLPTGTPTVLDAQSYLVEFYASLGFAPTGPEYVEDGIPHVPMRRQ